MKRSWQHKRDTLGEIISGIDDIKQCVDTIVSTTKGSVPLMPELGCELIEGIDENPEDTISFYKAMWLKEIPLQEPRCEVIDITGEFNEDGLVLMKIYFKEMKTGKTDYLKKHLRYGRAE